MFNQNIAFQDSTRITKWLKFFLQGCLVFTTIRIIYDYSNFIFFTDVIHGVYSDPKVLEDLREVKANKHALIVFLHTIVLAGTGLTFACWIYKANQNCRALGAKNMQFTPGWCIGWFFVPIWCLWMPYRALKEIWKESTRPNLRSELTMRPSLVIKTWWFCYIISNGFQGVLSFMLQTEDIAGLMDATRVAIFVDLLSYPICIAAITLVNQIYSKQMFSYQKQ